MGDYFVFSSYVYIRDKSDENLNVWNLKDGDPSSVGIQGDTVHRPDLRKSISIRDRFTVLLTRIHSLFPDPRSGPLIGDGSKHIYVKGDFIKPHRDRRLPDKNGLPHCMTLIIFDMYGYSGGSLIINGKDIMNTQFYNEDEFRSGYKIIVLMSLDCIHEVTEIREGVRHSFVFPVYGKYNPNLRLIKPVSINILDELDSVLNRYENKPIGEECQLAYLEGLFNALKDDECDLIIYKHRAKLGDCYCSYDVSKDVLSDPTGVYNTLDVTEISYIDPEGVSKKVSLTVVHESANKQDWGVNIPDGSTNIKVIVFQENGDERATRIKKIFVGYLRNRLDKIRLDNEEEFVRSNSLANQFLASNVSPPRFPEITFHLLLKGVYYGDSSIDSSDTWHPLDQFILKSLKEQNRQIVFVAGSIKESVLLIPVYKYETIIKNGIGITSLTKILSETDLPATYTVDELDAEFDDQGGYNPDYERTYGVLMISAVQTAKINVEELEYGEDAQQKDMIVCDDNATFEDR